MPVADVPSSGSKADRWNYGKRKPVYSRYESTMERLMAPKLALPTVLFLHIGWAREYRGNPNDPPLGKFGYFEKGNRSTAGETLNFRDYKGRCYGYAAAGSSINIDKLGAKPGSDTVGGILVIWTATEPTEGGRYIVGWSRNALVHRQLQTTRPDKTRPDFFVEAAAEDCHLVPIDERSFFIPAREKGWPGIAAAFFASENLSTADLRRVLAYVERGAGADGFVKAGPEKAPKGSPKGPSDPEVELQAVGQVRQYYEARQWTVRSVESENLGWDLDVRRGARYLRVEVKGRSGTGSVELTPNEYRVMQDNKLRLSYRLAVVHNALQKDKATTRIFAYAPAAKAWLAETGETLKVEPVMGARVSF